MKLSPRSAIVKTRSQRRYRAANNPKGVIYLPNNWLGKKVKVVERARWVVLVKRVHLLEHKLSKIGREVAYGKN